MKKKMVVFLMVFLLAIALPMVVQAEELSQSIESTWGGKLSFSGIELRVIFKIMKNTDGSLTATMDSPDQGAKDIPVDQVTFKDNVVCLEAKMIGLVYEGQLSSDGLKISGTFKQGPTELPLNLERDYIYIATKPQEPKKPYPYNEVEVSYMNEEDGVKLAGTLTIPQGEGPFTAVLLITGSGAQDRDESLLGHKPFLILADYLTRQGIAVLRVDDRGIGGTNGDFLNSTSADFAKDVFAGVEFLKSRQDVDSSQIGLIGHSEGGLIAPMVAVRSEDVGFIVLMAGPGIPGDQISYLQTELINRGSGVSEDVIQKTRSQQEQMFKILNEAADNKVAAEKLRAYLSEAVQDLTEEEREQIGDIDLYIDMQLMQVPWLRFFVSYDPVPTLRKVKCPVLAINGAKDVQVPPKENLQAIEAALKAGGNTDYTVIELPDLNHLFQTCETGLPTEYGSIQETISPVALKTIGDWILQHTQSGTSSQ